MAGSQAEPLKRKGGKRLRLTEFSWLFLARDVTGGIQVDMLKVVLSVSQQLLNPSYVLIAGGRNMSFKVEGEKDDVKMKTEKETAMDVKKKDPGKVPEAKQGTIKVAAQATTKKDEKKEDSKKTRTTAEAKPPKKEHSAPSEKQVKAKTERAKEEVGAASTKKAVPGKKEEKTTKTVEQEIRKEKSGKTSSVLKDKEPIKGKEVKVPASLKEKGITL
uniref:Triadin-like n=2 Tax=Delphinidae TaxID=9726 RepID=A0A6J3S8H4_TURTR|nr:triadin-like [Tursiops truncatus]